MPFDTNDNATTGHLGCSDVFETIALAGLCIFVFETPIHFSEVFAICKTLEVGVDDVLGGCDVVKCVDMHRGLQSVVLGNEFGGSEYECGLADIVATLKGN